MNDSDLYDSYIAAYQAVAGTTTYVGGNRQLMAGLRAVFEAGRTAQLIESAERTVDMMILGGDVDVDHFISRRRGAGS